MVEQANSVFKLLRTAGAKATEFLTRDAGITVVGHPVELAIDSQGLPLLLVPLSVDEPDFSDDKSRGIRIETYLLTPTDEASRTLLFRCGNGALTEQFARLVDDIIQSLAEDPELPGGTSIAVFERWRGLFEPNPSALLSREAQIGLLSELHFLERLLAADRLGSQGLAAWTGPDKSRHDFVVDGASVEVKATMNRDQFLIAIHGDRQLDSPLDGSLHLYAEQVEETPGGDTLTAAVERVSSLVDDTRGFLGRLQSAGYSVADSDAYRAFAFARVRSKVCEVGDTFPRVARSVLKDERIFDQIQNLQYSIDIGPLQPAAKDEVALDFATELIAQ
jgi:hypothetical protein